MDFLLFAKLHNPSTKRQKETAQSTQLKGILGYLFHSRQNVAYTQRFVRLDCDFNEHFIMPLFVKHYYAITVFFLCVCVSVHAHVHACLKTEIHSKWTIKQQLNLLIQILDYSQFSEHKCS